MFKNDILLDMIEALAKNLGKAIVDEKDDFEINLSDSLNDGDLLKIILKKMINDKKYNEAENTLFEYAESRRNNEISEVGEWFYRELSKISDIDLLENNFGREEINQGLSDLKKICTS